MVNDVLLRQYFEEGIECLTKKKKVDLFRELLTFC